MFKTRQPRKFNRVSIYTSERKDRLDKIVREAKAEMGELPKGDIAPDTFKGKFSKFTPRAQKASERGRRLTLPVVIIVLFLLVLAWRYIMTGKILF
ncbi:MAG: hypothetical protein LUC33_01730 [Prevotellaceae bacterium]|nr:hypothetical protein [Prevotellaceae bacterium]